MTPERTHATLIAKHSFEPEHHFYPRVINASIHPLVRYFMGLGNLRIAERYCHLHPEADPDAVTALLGSAPRFFRWAGTDLFHVTTETGQRHMVVIETNSSPSGQKSMPLLDEAREQGGYATLLERAFLPYIARRNLPKGELAVLYDKNEMETTGYAAALADCCDEAVYLVPFLDEDPDPPARFTNHGVLEVRTEDGQWRPIRAALRYVTQRPWNRIPVLVRSALFNQILVCLAGGRNKMLAAKAYDFFNAELRAARLAIRAPETIWDLSRDEVPLWVDRMGGCAVVKEPYANAGQGVFTITSPAELEVFMTAHHRYTRFIVQALIGNVRWSSNSRDGRIYHVGTVPDRSNQIFVADLRMMVGAAPDGFFPVAIYARRARLPLQKELDGTIASWSMLGTNLSVKLPDGSWSTAGERLLQMDLRHFNRLGIGLDEIIEGYIQTVMAVTAIDRMACRMLTQRQTFRHRFFRSISPDEALAREICR
ncbi:MAG: hypothetical protein HYV63_17495 [Candidatus Schekmanbacteria bacterium]|nr:hypothetical protein [Candidatus Schekmanbacteria bacterium]